MDWRIRSNMKIIKPLTSNQLSRLQRKIYWKIVGHYGYSIYWVDRISKPLSKEKILGSTFHEDKVVVISLSYMKILRKEGNKLCPLTHILLHELSHIRHYYIYELPDVLLDGSFEDFYKKTHPPTFDMIYSELADNFGIRYVDGRHYMNKERREKIKDQNTFLGIKYLTSSNNSR